MKSHRPNHFPTRTRVRGVTLIELMVALVLGLVVSGAALTLFVTNKQTYNASENLGRIQESERTAFELMARDIREAAGNPCSNSITFNNVLNNPYKWWSEWDTGTKGYGSTDPFSDAASAFGTAAGSRVTGTEAFEFKALAATDNVLSTSMTTIASPIALNSASGISAGDILGICEYGHFLPPSTVAHGNIFQASTVAGAVLTHTATGTPGNIDGNLPIFIYPAGSFIAKYKASRWYIGCNGRTSPCPPVGTPGGKSLYQTSLQNMTGVPATVNNEIAEGVDNMTLRYLLTDATDYVPWSAGIDWTKVSAVKVTLTLNSQDKIGTPFQRTLEHVITLRNRAP